MYLINGEARKEGKEERGNGATSNTSAADELRCLVLQQVSRLGIKLDVRGLVRNYRGSKTSMWSNGDPDWCYVTQFKN